MKNTLSILTLIILLLISCSKDEDILPPTVPKEDNIDAEYEEKNNIIVIEAEKLVLNNTWSISKEKKGYAGSGYIFSRKKKPTNKPGNGKIDVKIKINNTGDYLFQWRTKVGLGSNPTEHNDSWLRFKDADKFFGKRKSDGNIIYPLGTGKSPNPKGESADGWFKVYRSGKENWSWKTSTSDHDAHQIYVTFKNPGVYTMEISARSDNHIIDRIVLSKNYDNPTDLKIPETTYK